MDKYESSHQKTTKCKTALLPSKTTQLTTQCTIGACGKSGPSNCLSLWVSENEEEDSKGQRYGEVEFYSAGNHFRNSRMGFIPIMVRLFLPSSHLKLSAQKVTNFQFN